MSDKTSASEFRQRWTPSKIKKAMAALSKRRISRVDFESVEIDGKVHLDLRGFTASGMILRLKATHIDFSRSIFRLTCGLGFANLSNCLFRYCVYEGNIGEEFTDCDFSHSKLRNISALPGTKFRRCNFLGVDLTGSNFTEVAFFDCHFASAKLHQAEFIDCKIDGCHFESAVFGMGSFGGSCFSRLTCGFRWLDFESGEPVSHQVPDSAHVVDLQDTYMGGVKFD